MADIAAIPDAAIDASDIPELDDAFFRTARLIVPPAAGKRSISLRVDDDVLAWFRSQGKGHLSRMNAVLRAYMLARRAEEG